MYDLITLISPGKRMTMPEARHAAFPADQAKDDAFFVWRTINSGESISKVAQMYYDDCKLYPAIVNDNGLDNAAHVSVRQKIGVPTINDVPFTIISEG